jgi:Holliday junction resolvase RusA-like endonuclease
MWVQERPKMSGKGKQVYYEATRAAARLEIANPIASDDVEIEISYTTSKKKRERKDADNVNKPTSDALEGVAYLNDRQMRWVTSTIFDKNMSLKLQVGLNIWASYSTPMTLMFCS